MPQHPDSQRFRPHEALAGSRGFGLLPGRSSSRPRTRPSLPASGLHLGMLHLAVLHLAGLNLEVLRLAVLHLAVSGHIADTLDHLMFLDGAAAMKGATPNG